MVMAQISQTQELQIAEACDPRFKQHLMTLRIFCKPTLFQFPMSSTSEYVVRVDDMPGVPRYNVID